MDNVLFRSLSPDDVEMLYSFFLHSKIDLTISFFDWDKSHGLDGYNFSFTMIFWHLFKDDVWFLFDQFHFQTSLPRSFPSLFITLILKVESPPNLMECCPIYLVDLLYKLINKYLAFRLSKVMDNLISPSQSNFLKWRLLVDGVVVVNKLVDMGNRYKKYFLIFKVDLKRLMIRFIGVSYTICFLDLVLIRNHMLGCMHVFVLVTFLL